MSNPFEYIAPAPESILKISEVRRTCKELSEVLETLIPSRERSLAITKLEEVSMWANKSIVFHQDEVMPGYVPPADIPKE